MASKRLTANCDEVDAWSTPDGKQWWIACELCRRWHYHGAGEGDRFSHCPHRDGYVLVYAGQLSREQCRSPYSNRLFPK